MVRRDLLNLVAKYIKKLDRFEYIFSDYIVNNYKDLSVNKFTAAPNYFKYIKINNKTKGVYKYGHKFHIYYQMARAYEDQLDEEVELYCPDEYPPPINDLLLF
jgi:hypothetical protein